MRKTNHPKDQPPEDALFRYQILSQVLVRKHQGLTNPDAIEAVANSPHATLAGLTRTVSKRSIYRWLANYKKNDFAGLLPSPRKSVEPSALSLDLLNFFKEQKEADPRTSVPELIRRAKALYLVPADAGIDRTTVWRNLNRMGVTTKRCKQVRQQNKKRFAYPHRMDMILCDGKHFRAGITRKRRVALFFLDDATRMILGVKVGTAESAQLFLHGLYQVINAYGRMTTIFLDNGPGFTAGDTINVLRKLDILLINGTVAYPEGHGKIERFNQTAQEQILRLLDKNPEVDPGCTALDLRINHYLSNQYVHTPHEGLNKETPWSRFHNDKKQLRFFENQNQIRQAFILHETRRVSADNVISFKSTNYEIPPGHAGEAITLRRNALDETLAILHHEKIVTLSPVDLHINARDKRTITRKTAEQKQLPKSSAQISYDKEVKPIIDADGGFNAPPQTKEKS